MLRLTDQVIDRVLGVIPRIHAGDDEPLPAMVSSPERLEQHAAALALTHDTQLRHGRWHAFALRSRDNARVLARAYQSVAAAAGGKRAITPAADWLLNNFHVIEEQLRDIHKLLPAQFYRHLPKLAQGEMRSLPRVYAIAWDFVAHLDGRFDPDLLLRFMRAYQRVRVLTIGELWALPIMLRIVMVESLRRLAVRIVASISSRAEADEHVDDVLDSTDSEAERHVALEKRLRTRPLTDAYAVQVLQRLHYGDTHAAQTLAWLNRRLAQDGRTAETLMQEALRRQSASNLSVRNLITGMRLVSAYDWETFFEAASPVNDVLNEHPDFAAMDFKTRDRYRHAI